MEKTAVRDILAIGLDVNSRQIVSECCDGRKLIEVSDASEFEGKFEQWADGQFAAIFCGGAIEAYPSTELAQVLQNQCPETHKYFITSSSDLFQPSVLLKNGFDKAFFMPRDKGYLSRTIQDENLTQELSANLRAVKVFDFDANSPLDFETHVFLPMNKKFVRLNSVNNPIRPDQIERLKKKQINTIYIDNKDMDKFHKYSANRLLAISSDSQMTATEREARLCEQVRNIFSSIFDTSSTSDLEQGREILKTCHGVISNYITQGKNSDWYHRLLTSMGEQFDNYSHASRVSTFAALFAIGIGHASPEDLALAGMFHDLGLDGLPPDLANKPESEMSEEEKNLYYSHPERSLQILKSKRISVVSTVEKAILQHHEKISGKGFPKNLNQARISEEAQIISYADQFDDLTTIQPGKKQFTPPEAHEEIKKTISINPDLLKKIGSLFKT